MDDDLSQINDAVFAKCGLTISNFRTETESKEYYASRFDLDRRRIICRSSKITPKKLGQFVTFWKRNENGPIEPFHVNDSFDFFIVNVRTEHAFGQFVFPKLVLAEKGILSTETKEGKRAFRVYPVWETVQSKQAERSQKWQLNFFYQLSDSLDVEKVLPLYQTNY